MITPDRRDFSHVVVGGGPVAVLAAAAVQNSGRRTILLTNDSAGMLWPSPPQDGSAERITVVPIFPPVGETQLTRLVAGLGAPLPRMGTALQVQYTNTPMSVAPPARPDASRLADATLSLASALTPLGEVPSILARKQYGSRTLTEPMMLVREKISRSYYNDQNREAGRMGYIDGQSPYSRSIAALSARLTRESGRIRALNAARRVVYLEDECEIRYETMTYTSNLSFLARLLGLPPLSPEGVPAFFVSGSSDKRHAANLMIYDLDPTSPVLRVLTPTPTRWVAQLGCDAAAGSRTLALGMVSTEAEKSILGAVGELLGRRVASSTQFSTHLHAYPVDPLQPERIHEVEETCRDGGIRRFGRFAEWRYVDLHELDWGELIRE